MKNSKTIEVKTLTGNKILIERQKKNPGKKLKIKYTRVLPYYHHNFQNFIFFAFIGVRAKLGEM